MYESTVHPNGNCPAFLEPLPLPILLLFYCNKHNLHQFTAHPIMRQTPESSTPLEDPSEAFFTRDLMDKAHSRLSKKELKAKHDTTARVIRGLKKLPMERRQRMLDSMVETLVQSVQLSYPVAKDFVMMRVMDTLLEMDEEPSDFFPEGYYDHDQPDVMMKAALAKMKETPDYVKPSIFACLIAIILIFWWK